jgi:Zn-dependent protease
MFNLSIASILYRVVTLLIAFTVHEFAHAYVADRYGDDTPRINGRLTLNPLSHIDPFGALMLVVAGFGWAKPVPINPYVLRRRSDSAVMWVSLAGPLSNLVLAIFGSLVFLVLWTPMQGTGMATSGFTGVMIEFLYIFIIINLSLMVFNLLPIAPLDGEKVLEFFLPPTGKDLLASIRPYGSILLLVVIFLLPSIGFDVLGAILRPVLTTWMNFLVG